MKAAILAIGDEIQMGQVVNSNAAYMSSTLTNLGIAVVVHSTVGDDVQDIVNELRRLCSIADIVLCTGGLGPTHDDRTKDALLVYYSDSLVQHEPTQNRIRELVTRSGRALTDINAAQALVPSRCIVLENHLGTAPGMLFDENDDIVVSLPGVPDEMKALMSAKVIPYIKRKIDIERLERWEYQVLSVAGIAESALAELIGDVTSFLGNSSLAFLPSYDRIRLRIGVVGKDVAARRQELERVKSIIVERCASYIYAYGDVSLANAVAERLISTAETLSVAESCTGGLLASELTSIPGSSIWFKGGVVSYANSAKTDVLGVHLETITEYGAVSEQVAEEMAIGICNRMKTTYGVSVTGVAGPGGGTRAKPVGTVWIGVLSPNGIRSHLHHFGGNRNVVRSRSVAAALIMLWKVLNDTGN